jgi:phosphoserine phosphatase RsbU/P
MSVLLDMQAPATLDGVRCLRHALERATLRHPLEAAQRQALLLGLTELATNSVKHAAPSVLTLYVVREEQGLLCVLGEDGPHFAAFDAQIRQRLTSMDDPLSEPELIESGMGLSLIAQCLPGVQCRREADFNRYTWRVAGSRPRLRVAVVDDDPLIRELISLYLADDYQVSVFDSAFSALQALTESPPDVVLSDIYMPEMDGLSLRQVLAERSHTAVTPFVFISGSDDDVLREQTSALGIDDYLCKPLERRQLIQVVERVYQRSLRIQVAAQQLVESGITVQLQPVLPAVAGPFQLAMAHRPAEAGGGDFVFHRQQAGRHTLVLGDCMGHGQQAKVFAHAYQAYLSSTLGALDTLVGPAQVLAQLSDAMQTDQLLSQSLLTCIVMQWQDDEWITLACAGHPPPLLCNGDTVVEVPVAGMLPGLMADTRYQNCQVQLRRGSRLCLYSDGLLAGLATRTDEAQALQCLSANLRLSAHQPLAIQAHWLLEQGATARDDACVILLENPLS